MQEQNEMQKKQILDKVIHELLRDAVGYVELMN
jgi:hypothetical protein